MSLEDLFTGKLLKGRQILTKKFHGCRLYLTPSFRGHTVLSRFCWQQPLCLLETVCVMLRRWEVKKAPINWTTLSFVSYPQLHLAKWPQTGPQPHHKTQPFLLADEIANRNSKWRCATQPQRNPGASKIPKPKPISIHNRVALHLTIQHCWIIWSKSPGEISRVRYLFLHSGPSIFQVIWTEYFTARWYHMLRKYIGYLKFGRHLFPCPSTQCM